MTDNKKKPEPLKTERGERKSEAVDPSSRCTDDTLTDDVARGLKPTPMKGEEEKDGGVKNRIYGIDAVGKENRDKLWLKAKEVDRLRRDPRSSEFPENIMQFLPPAPDYPKFASEKNLKLTALDKEEVLKRENLLSSAIPITTRFTPLASKHLDHWFSGKGGIIKLSREIINNPKIDIFSHLKNMHVPVLIDGIERRTNPKNEEFVPPDKINALFYQDTFEVVTKLQLATKQMEDKLGKQEFERYEPEWDFFSALGYCFVASELVHRGREIIRWRFQIYDQYDWAVDSNLPLLTITKELEKYHVSEEYVVSKEKTGPYTVIYLKSTWFMELEIYGRPRWYDIFSEILTAPLDYLKK